MEPLVSVIVPTYYRNERLQATLDSVVTQSHGSIEVFVVDDSGKRHAQEAVDAVNAGDTDIQYIAHEENEGAHAARDTGLRHASGAYVQFLDDDDLLLAGKISRQVELLEQVEDTGAAYCGLVYEGGATHRPDPNLRGDVFEASLRFPGDPLTTSTMLIDADVLKRIRPLARKSKGADDTRMVIRLSQQTQFDFLDDVLVVSGRSANSRGSSWGGVEGRWDIFETFSELYEDAPADIYREALAETYRLQGRRCLEDRRWSPTAIYSFGQAIRYAPEIETLHIGEFLSSFAGRPGREIASRFN